MFPKFKGPSSNCFVKLKSKKIKENQLIMILKHKGIKSSNLGGDEWTHMIKTAL